MPLDAAMLESDLGEILADFPQSVTFVRGARRFTAPCAVSELPDERSVGDGGAGALFMGTVSLVVGSRRCAFAPRPGDYFSVGESGRSWRVEAVRLVPGDAAYSISGVPS